MEWRFFEPEILDPEVEETALTQLSELSRAGTAELPSSKTGVLTDGDGDKEGPY